MSHPGSRCARARASEGGSPRLIRRLLPPLAAASVLFLAGCVPVVATGPMTSEEREIGAVTAVTLDTSGDLSISEGAPGLVIHAPSEALDRLTSETNGETLVLGTTPGPSFVVGEIRYELTVPDLEAIDVNGSGDVVSTVSSEGEIRLDLDGSGDVEWTGLDADRVTIRIAGSGDVEIGGVTNELDIDVDGSGNIEAGSLDAADAVVSIAGSGDVFVSASEALSVEILGSGRVTYSGDPTVTADVTGSGDVVRGEP